MIVIHLARKPLSEGSVAANTLKHETGALNIDGGRVQASDAGEGRRRHGGGSNAVYVRPGDRAAAAWTHKKGDPMPPGRWPANLTLEHRPECRQEGVKQVKPSDGSGRAGPGGHGFRTDYVGGAKKGEGFTGGHVDADGLEIVEAWVCVPGCPVADLDEQSGLVKGTLRQPTGKAVYPTQGTAMVWNSNDVRDSTVRGYEDEGGASRFFQQVGGRR